MTANEKRTAVVRKYDVILGRNNYSQPKREYCYKKYSNGKYYGICERKGCELMNYITIYVEVSEEYDGQSLADAILDQLYDMEGVKDIYNIYVEEDEKE